MQKNSKGVHLGLDFCNVDHIETRNIEIIDKELKQIIN